MTKLASPAKQSQVRISAGPAGQAGATGRVRLPRDRERWQQLQQGGRLPATAVLYALGKVSVLDTMTFIKTFSVSLYSQFLENTTPAADKLTLGKNVHYGREGLDYTHSENQMNGW